MPEDVMAAKVTTAEVVIDGKVYTISGSASEEYFQKIATYLNGKISELRGLEGYNRLTTDYRNVLLNINIADDYFRADKQIRDLHEDEKTKEKDLYSLKHDLVTTQMKLEATEKNLRAARREAEDKDKRIIQLETELKAKQ